MPYNQYRFASEEDCGWVDSQPSAVTIKRMEALHASFSVKQEQEEDGSYIVTAKDDKSEEDILTFLEGWIKRCGSSRSSTRGF
jgi:hypothetical protein